MRYLNQDLDTFIVGEYEAASLADVVDEDPDYIIRILGRTSQKSAVTSHDERRALRTALRGQAQVDGEGGDPAPEEPVVIDDEADDRPEEIAA